MYIYGDGRPTGELRYVWRLVNVPRPDLGENISQQQNMLMLQQAMVVQGEKEKIEWWDVRIHVE